MGQETFAEALRGFRGLIDNLDFDAAAKDAQQNPADPSALEAIADALELKGEERIDHARTIEALGRALDSRDFRNSTAAAVLIGGGMIAFGVTWGDKTLHKNYGGDTPYTFGSGYKAYYVHISHTFQQ